MISTLFNSSNNLINGLIHIVIAGLIFWLIWWFVTWCGTPQPFLKVIQVILGLVAILYLINVLLSLNGGF